MALDEAVAVALATADATTRTGTEMTSVSSSPLLDELPATGAGGVSAAALGAAPASNMAMSPRVMTTDAAILVRVELVCVDTLIPPLKGSDLQAGCLAATPWWVRRTIDKQLSTERRTRKRM